MATSQPLPSNLAPVRDAAKRALAEVEPAGPPRSDAEGNGLFLAARTNGGRSLPPYYLVYFLFIDLLGYPSLGQAEKSAWTVPVRFRGRLYVIEHRKMGLGIFAPNLEPNARSSGTPSEQAELDSIEIASLVSRAVSAAEPYFRWRADEAVVTEHLSVLNKSSELFERHEYFKTKFTDARERADGLEHRTIGTMRIPKDYSGWRLLRQEADWNGQSAIDAFFSWTEHVFIHIAILQSRLRTGKAVAELASADWKSKFKSALDVSDLQAKAHYDTLLDLRAQIRNFVAHGAFGKRGEAFRFHSGAGAVPVILTDDQRQMFSLTGRTAFEEGAALAEIESFLNYLWSGPRSNAHQYIFSGLPSILSFTVDGTYARAMSSEKEMNSLVRHLMVEADRAADMDW
jgi:hypothetical protein